MGRRSALLPAVKLDGLVNLNVQPRHDLPRDLGDRRLVRVLRLFIRPAQTDKALGDLHLLRVVKAQLGFGRKLLRDRVGPNIDPAGVDLALLEEEQVAGLGPDIQEHRAAVQIAVIKPKSIAQGGRGNIDQLQAQARGFGRAEQALDDIGLDRHQEHFQLPVGRRAQDLVVPDHFFQGKRHVLLGLILDDLRDLGGVDRGELDEFGKDVKARRANVGFARAKASFGEELLDRLAQDRFPRALLGAFQAQRTDAITFELESSGLVQLKLRRLQSACSKVQT